MNSKSNICFVHLSNLYTAPYLRQYLNILINNYDLIYWDRYDIEEKNQATNTYRFSYPISRDSKRQKIVGYLKFRKFAIKKLKENKYKKIVLLSNNLAVLLSSYLLNEYKGKYIIDIRDYFREKEEWCFQIEKKLIYKSYMTMISSGGFKTFLPQFDYVLTHNIPSLEKESIIRVKKINAQFRREKVLACVGGMKFREYDQKVLSYFANDNRFELHYIGAGYASLETYCNKNNIRNVVLHDRFKPEETLSFFEGVDAILNLYGNDTPILDYAISNKLYYAAYLEIPILVCPNTYMEKVTENYNIGFTVNIGDQKCKDKLEEYLFNLDRIEFGANAARYISDIQSDIFLFRKRVEEFYSK